MLSSNPKSHPISRCPLDIVKYIFELAIIQNDNLHGPRSLKAATIISSVCREWRSIALATPTLWADIWCPLHRPAEALQYFWSLASIRVKDVPAKICITTDEEYDEAINPIQYCKLDMIARIKHLVLYFASGDHTNLLLDPVFSAHITGTLDTLELDCLGLDWTELDCGQLLTQLPPIRRLIVIGRNNFPLALSSSENYANIRTLKLELVRALPIMLILSLLPRMEHFQLLYSYTDMDEDGYRDQEDEGDSTSKINLPSIHQLDLLAAQECHWLKHIFCPNINTFKFDGRAVYPDSSQDFISLHTTITTLYHLSDDHLLLENTASQIQHLGIHVWKAEYYQRPSLHILKEEFPSLRSLTIDDMFVDLPLILLENLIQERCLPQGHPQNKRAPTTLQLERLVIMFNRKTKLEDVEWSHSVLFREASQYVLRHDDSINPDYGDDRSSVTLWWS